MTTEAMEAEDSIVATVKSENSKTQIDPETVKVSPVNGNNNSTMWIANGESHSSTASGFCENKPNKSQTFNFISSEVTEDKNNSSETTAWSIRSPRPMKVPFSCPSYTILHRRSSQENSLKPKKVIRNGDQAKVSNSDSRRSLVFPSKSPSSAFSDISQQRAATSPEETADNNLLKRCNSAPALNDFEGEEMSTSWPSFQLQASRAGRMRRFSATVVSANASPISRTGRPNSRLRLDQLKKEESLEGIQNKETEHEREVQATIQISSNCSDLSLGEQRRNSLDGCFNQSFSPKCRMSPSALPLKPHFPAPALASGKSSHSRAIDFNVPFNHMGSLSPTSTHHQPYPPSGIPSPLTFAPSLSLFSSSPLPPSPTRSLSGPRKQCFSPSMQVPVSLSRATSRSPSPSPTRRAFATRRRSQSPCIMRPSALGAIKRKCDSDTEGSSPKRIFVPAAQGLTLPGLALDPPTTGGAASPAFPQRMLVQRTHSSLSSSSMDSSDASITPSPPFHALPSFATQHVGSTTIPHRQYHIPVQSTPQEQSSRPLSPASSTCSSSSLEGIRDLQPLISPAHVTAGRKLQPKEALNASEMEQTPTH